MFGFLIKKSFFDLWDNFLPAILINIGFIVVLTIPLLLPSATIAGGAALSIAILVVGVLIAFIYLGGVFVVAREITDYQSLTWSTLTDGIRDNLTSSLFLGGIFVLHAFLLSVAVPVYTGLGNLVGLLALAFLFWMSVIWLLTAQYFLPIRVKLDNGIKKSLRKSFLLSFDNTGFTISLAIGAVVIILMSIFTAFLFPGIAGLAIWFQSALRLRMYKYDYLDEHPEEDRRSIPWDALLYDERERVGKRTLRGMIFPWKE